MHVLVEEYSQDAAAAAAWPPQRLLAHTKRLRCLQPMMQIHSTGKACMHLGQNDTSPAADSDKVTKNAGGSA